MINFWSNEDWILKSLIKEMEPRHLGRDRVCPKCQMTWSDVSAMSKLGCSECYEVYQGMLEQVVVRLQGSREHIGKLPERQGKHVLLERKISVLREEMQLAIDKQEFEKAAKLRDEIIEIEEEGETLVGKK